MQTVLDSSAAAANSTQQQQHQATPAAANGMEWESGLQMKLNPSSAAEGNSANNFNTQSGTEDQAGLYIWKGKKRRKFQAKLAIFVPYLQAFMICDIRKIKLFLLK